MGGQSYEAESLYLQPKAVPTLSLVTGRLASDQIRTKIFSVESNCVTVHGRPGSKIWVSSAPELSKAVGCSALTRNQRNLGVRGDRRESNGEREYEFSKRQDCIKTIDQVYGQTGWALGPRASKLDQKLKIIS